MDQHTSHSSPATNVTKGEKSRTTILDAATALFSAAGYDATSIGSISSSSGFPNSSIYWHFGSKAGVLAAVIERAACKTFSDVSAQDLNNEQLKHSGFDLLSSRFHSMRTGLENHPEFLRILLLLQLTGAPQGAAEQALKAVTTQGRSIIRAAIFDSHKELGETRATAIADHFTEIAFTYFNGAFITAAPHGPLDLASHVNTLITFVHSAADSFDSPE